MTLSRKFTRWGWMFTCAMALAGAMVSLRIAYLQRWRDMPTIEEMAMKSPNPDSFRDQGWAYYSLEILLVAGAGMLGGVAVSGCTLALYHGVAVVRKRSSRSVKQEASKREPASRRR